jgi:hypothetical protein
VAELAFVPTGGAGLPFQRWLFEVPGGGLPRDRAGHARSRAYAAYLRDTPVEVRRTTITLPDELSDAIERFRRDQPVPAPLSGVVQAATEEYLARRGYGAALGGGPLRITPAARARRLTTPVWTYDHHFDVVRIEVWRED